MAKDSFKYITESYSSNCLFEAIKAKIKNPLMKKLNCRGIVHSGTKDALGSLREISQNDILTIEIKGETHNEDGS